MNLATFNKGEIGSFLPARACNKNDDKACHRPSGLMRLKPAHVVADSNLSVQLGSDANVKALRAVKTELDAANTFPNHPFAGLYQPPLNTSSPIFATAG